MSKRRIANLNLVCEHCGKTSGEHRFLDGACPVGEKDSKGYYADFYSSTFKVALKEARAAGQPKDTKP